MSDKVSAEVGDSLRFTGSISNPAFARSVSRESPSSSLRDQFIAHFRQKLALHFPDRRLVYTTR